MPPPPPHAPLSPASFVIKTPCSSANIGPGFDVIGLALSIYLELHVTITPPSSTTDSSSSSSDSDSDSSNNPLNCRVSYEGQGEAAAGQGQGIPLDPAENLITRVALYVLRCHGQRAFPRGTHVHIKNPIPLGRGLGSSGAAVVAGVILGREVGGLRDVLSDDRLFDFCLMIGREGTHVLFFETRG